MDQKEFDQWMEWSEIASEQDRMRQMIVELPKKKLREFLIRLQDLFGDSLPIGYLMNHREELADQIFELKRSSKD